METTGQYAGLIKYRTRSMGGNNSGFDNWQDWGNNMDLLFTQNMWWVTSALAVRKLADAPDSGATQAQKDWIDGRIASIKANMNKFWMEGLQAYGTPWSSTSNATRRSPSVLADGSHVVDDRMNAMGVLNGMIPKEKYPRMRELFRGSATNPQYKNAGIYMEKYVIEALYKMGYPEDAMKRSSDRHWDMVNEKELSAMPEHWDYRTNGSVGHGWSGGTMIALSRYATGVEPTAAGYSSWHVVPQMGNFISIDTRVPAEIGNIDVLLDQDADTGDLTMSVTSPGNEAEIWVPVEDGKFAVQTAGAKAEFVAMSR